MLSHEYFESLILIIAHVLLVQLQVRITDVLIYTSDNTPETSYWRQPRIYLMRIILKLTILSHIQK